MSTVSTTISLQIEQLLKVQDYARLHKLTRSRAMSYLIKMGFVYLQFLEEQRHDFEKALDSAAKAA